MAGVASTIQDSQVSLDGTMVYLSAYAGGINQTDNVYRFHSLKASKPHALKGHISRDSLRWGLVPRSRIFRGRGFLLLIMKLRTTGSKDEILSGKTTTALGRKYNKSRGRLLHKTQSPHGH